jgi:integrase
LSRARWSDVDLEQRVWNKPNTKSGRSHRSALPKAAADIISKLPSRDRSEYLFPSTLSTIGHIRDAKKAWARIRKAAGVEDARIHDLRRTCASWAAAANFSLPLIGAALGHSSTSATAIYARLALDPVRQMLGANAAALMSAMQKPPTEVVRSKRGD